MTKIVKAKSDRFMSNFNEERVLSVHHWTDRLFSFRTTRDPSFRFRSGQFTMIGIPVDGKPLLRAYSVASALTRTNWNSSASKSRTAR